MCRPVYLLCTVPPLNQEFYNCQTHKRFQRKIIYCDRHSFFNSFFKVFVFVFLELQQTAHHAQTTSARMHHFQMGTSQYHGPKLQALLYDILPSTTAVFRYAIGSRKLSANEQFFCWRSNSSKCVTNNSDYIRRLYYNCPCCLRQLK